jgi:hypothetical protein
MKQLRIPNINTFNNAFYFKVASRLAELNSFQLCFPIRIENPKSQNAYFFTSAAEVIFSLEN